MLIKKRTSLKKILPGIIAVALMVFGVSYFVYSIRKMDNKVYRNAEPILSPNIIVNKEASKKEVQEQKQTIFNNPNFKNLQKTEIDTRFATGNPNIFE